MVPFVEAHESGPLQQLTVRSLDMFDDLVASVRREAGERVDYARCGSLEVARTNSQRSRLQALARSMPTRSLHWLEASAARRMQPALSSESVGALFVPFHGYVGASALTHALAAAAINAGARFRMADVARVEASRAGEVQIVEAAGEAHRYHVAVLAMGSWTSRMQATGFALPQIHPVKGQLLRVKCSGGAVQQVLWSSDCYGVPQENGDVLVGATVEDAGFDEQPTTAAAEGLLAEFHRLLPGLSAKVVAHHVGLRPAAPDALPIIGRSSEAPAIVFATGHFRNGIVLAPLTARLVADVILEAGDDAALPLVSPSRFGL